MSSSDANPAYAIVLRHLAADVKTAGAALPDVKMDGVTSKKLQSMLDALATLAPKVSYPAIPELRITSIDGMFVVKVKGGQLELVSWSTSRPGGGALTAAQIMAAITGEGAEADAPSAGVRNSGGSPAATAARGKNMMMVTALIIAIVGVNAFTVWFVTKPKKTLLPKYAVLPPEPAERLLTNVAGVYETGGSPGDRQLKIMKEGDAEWIKFGPERAARDKKQFKVTAAQAGGKPALVTSRKAMIEIKDQLTVVMYGDNYRRVTR